MKDAGSWIQALIRNYVDTSAENSLQNAANEKAWDEPLIGFSRGNDPLYLFFKNDIGPFFWTPEEIFSLVCPGARQKPEELTVISWVLPQTGLTRSANRQQAQLPAERWVRSRNFGEMFNAGLARHVVKNLQDKGIQAVAPAQAPGWSWQESPRYGPASNWSERHAAYVSGLGTFGLCDGLITKKGKAMRCGSVIAGVDIEPTRREYEDYRAYCLFPRGKCRKCIARCPCGAITVRGHDKAKCRAYLFETVAPFAKAQFGIESYGCGLCQTGVPCESRVPLETEVS